MTKNDIMKALTVKQPWASLIVEGIKDIENRTWKTNYRGRILIHSSKMPEKGLPCEVLNSMQYSIVFTANSLDALIGENGVILGSVEIVDCVLNHTSIWAEKTDGVTDSNTGEFIPRREPKPVYNWVLANPVKFETPIPAKGKLGFWEFNGTFFN